MPFYEFHCSKCEEDFEFLLKVGQSKRKCPECGTDTLEKHISRVCYQDNYSQMHPRKGRGNSGRGRIDPGVGYEGLGRGFGV